MQLIVESVSQRLRELGLSFYGNANGSSWITSHCLSGGREMPGSEAVSVSREVSHSLCQGALAVGSPQEGTITCCLLYSGDLCSHPGGWFLDPLGSPFFSKELHSPQEQGQRQLHTCFLAIFLHLLCCLPLCQVFSSPHPSFVPSDALSSHVALPEVLWSWIN